MVGEYQSPNYKQLIVGQKSKIEWTDRTWNPVTGCTKVSQGCKNCYAERIYERFHGDGSFRDVQEHPERLSQPMHWKNPEMVFVNSMSDLFHEKLSFEFIDAVFSVMSDIDWHIYQVLTKRPERMAEFYKWKEQEFGIPWVPKDNVWVGVSAEDQKTYDERVPILLQLKTPVRFVSLEPLLGPIDMWLMGTAPDAWGYQGYTNMYNLLHWVIVGGESGPNARPMHAHWAKSIQMQCKDVDIPFFFKQWGNWLHSSQVANNNVWMSVHRVDCFYKSKVIHAWPDGSESRYLTKSAAGKTLDGNLYDEMPKNHIYE